MAQVTTHGLSMLDKEDMDRGWDRMPTVESDLAYHLPPSHGSEGLPAMEPKLPSKADKLTASV